MVYFSIGKCMRFLSNFPQYGKVQQNPWYGESLGIDTHTFFIVWVLFSHSIPILWYISLYEKCMGFSMNFPQYAKMQQNPWYGESLWNWYSYFFHSMGAFFPSYSHPMVYFIIWEMHGFPHQFLIVRENATKLTVWDETGKLVLILFFLKKEKPIPGTLEFKAKYNKRRKRNGCNFTKNKEYKYISDKSMPPMLTKIFPYF